MTPLGDGTETFIDSTYSRIKALLDCQRASYIRHSQFPKSYIRAIMHNKGPAPVHHDGNGLRIGIVHARWNDSIIDALLAGTKAKLLECGVQESDIVVQSVPGSWELPIAVQRCVTPRLCSTHEIPDIFA